MVAFYPAMRLNTRELGTTLPTEPFESTRKRRELLHQAAHLIPALVNLKMHPQRARCLRWVDTVEKVENRMTPKISQNVDFGQLRR
jgi:hypothetical protein